MLAHILTWHSIIIKRGGGWITLAGLTPSHCVPVPNQNNRSNPVAFCACPKPESGFLTLHVMMVFFVFSDVRRGVIVAFFVFSDVRRGVIVLFVDIGGFVRHHCLSFPFTNVKKCIVMKKEGYNLQIHINLVIAACLSNKNKCTRLVWRYQRVTRRRKLKVYGV